MNTPPRYPAPDYARTDSSLLYRLRWAIVGGALMWASGILTALAVVR